MNYSWDGILAPHRDTLFSGRWPTIIELLLIAEREHGERNAFTAFTPERNTLTYSEVLAEVQRVGSFLVEAGIQKGDRVVINGKNSPAWAIAYFGALWAGAVAVPLDNQMLIDRVESLCSFVKPSFLFADATVLKALDPKSTWQSALLGKASLLGDQEGTPSINSLEPKDQRERVSLTCDDMAAILFTSGTTGDEKGAMLSHANLISDIYQASEPMFLHLDETAVLYALLPLHHSYCFTAVLLGAIKHGAECVFGQDVVVSRMINDLKRGKVTVFMGIPLLYNKILSGILKQVKKQGFIKNALVRTMMAINGVTKKYLKLNLFRPLFNKLLLNKVGLDHNHILICGAGPLSPKVFRQYQQLGLDFVQGYGLTETSPILTLNPTSKFKVHSVGKVLPLIDMIIADPDSSGVGEIRVKGPNVTVGYYQDTKKTAELFDSDGYLKTGDLGYLDSENYLYLKGRAKNLIVTEGGKNVYPEQIEDLFQLYNEVEQILIRGYQVKADIPGDAIEAIIYPNMEHYQESELSIEEDLKRIVSEVNQHLSLFEKINRLRVTDSPMDMTSTKKIKRDEVAI